MKFVITALACCVAVAGLAADADASSRKRGKFKAYPRYVGYYDRPSTVAANGLCQRDNGKPESQLNFRNRCDTEEFWARINERAFSGGRR